MSTKVCSRFGAFAGMLLMNVAFLANVSFAAQPKAAEPKAADDSQALHKSLHAYVADFNKGDAAAVAGHFTADAEYIREDGSVLKGKAEIEKALKGYFAKNKGAKLAVELDSVQLVRPDVAIERGKSTTIAEGLPSRGTYVAIHTKGKDGWKIQSIQDLPLPLEPNAADHLSELGWLIGEWSEASDHTTVRTRYEWTANRTFLMGSYSVAVHGEVDRAGTQIIGWDPIEKGFRSWNFASDGSFGQGAWTAEGDHWVVKTQTTLPDGGMASAVMIYRPLDSNTMEWSARDRQVEGRLMPDIAPIKVTRAGTKSTAALKPSTTKPATRKSTSKPKRSTSTKPATSKKKN